MVNGNAKINSDVSVSSEEANCPVVSKLTAGLILIEGTVNAYFASASIVLRLAFPSPAENESDCAEMKSSPNELSVSDEAVFFCEREICALAEFHLPVNDMVPVDFCVCDQRDCALCVVACTCNETSKEANESDRDASAERDEDIGLVRKEDERESIVNSGVSVRTV